MNLQEVAIRAVKKKHQIVFGGGKRDSSPKIPTLESATGTSHPVRVTTHFLFKMRFTVVSVVLECIGLQYKSASTMGKMDATQCTFPFSSQCNLDLPRGVCYNAFFYFHHFYSSTLLLMYFLWMLRSCSTCKTLREKLQILFHFHSAFLSKIFQMQDGMLLDSSFPWNIRCPFHFAATVFIFILYSIYKCNLQPSDENSYHFYFVEEWRKI